MVATDVLELLKQQLASGQSLEQTVKELAQADPELAPVVQLISQRETEMQQGLEQEELQAEQDERDLEEEAERREQVAAVRVQFDELTAELQALRSRCLELAGALGACPACFGDDQDCSWCRGRGRPGFMPAEPSLFERLVIPAVKLQVRLQGRPSAAVDRGSTDERGAQ